MTTERPRWWMLSRDEQKIQIEDAVEWYLSQNEELTDREKLLLADAISLVLLSGADSSCPRGHPRFVPTRERPAAARYLSHGRGD
jgi:hypothetical protein